MAFARGISQSSEAITGQQVLKRSMLARFDRIVQQQAMAASHHPGAMCHKTARLALARVALEVLLGPAKAEQDLCDGAIALSTQPCIERPQ